jgi:hypothetical protein
MLALSVKDGTSCQELLWKMTIMTSIDFIIGNHEYDTILENNVHYLLGRNINSYSYIAGYGNDNVINSEKLSVSYGTSATTAAVGNDSRFGKVGVSEAEYRSEDPNPAISYYKLGLINSGQTDSDKVKDLSVTSANFVYNSE